MHTAMHGLFNHIAMEHYDKYIRFLTKYNELTNNNEQWDILSKTPEQNSEYMNLIRDRQKNAMISIVFAVMSIESLINEYGFVFLGEARFMALDKLNIQDKIVIFYAEVTGIDFPKGNKLYQQIKDLISVRNTLVHNKSFRIDVQALMRTDGTGDKAFLNYINSMVGNSKTKQTKQKLLEDVIVDSNSVYSKLKIFLQTNSPQSSKV